MNFTYDEIDRMYDAAKSLAHRRSQLKSKGWAFVEEQYDWIKYNQKYWKRSPKDFVPRDEQSSFRYLVNQLSNLSESLNEMSNTFHADVNEIGLAIMLGDDVSSKIFQYRNLKSVLKKRKTVIGDRFAIELEAAANMASKIKQWAKKHGYTASIKKTYWTARPGLLSKIVKVPVDQKSNPTDVLIEFEDGKFLGISAKTTVSYKNDLTIKNLGLGTLVDILGIRREFDNTVISRTAEFINSYNLPETARERNKAIRADAELKAAADEAGSELLQALRDQLVDAYDRMDNATLIQHILRDWMSADTVSYPKYIKVLSNANSVKIVDPTTSGIVKALESGAKVDAVPTGNDSLIIQANGQNLLRIRFKFKDIKMASSIKFSAEPLFKQ